VFYNPKRSIVWQEAENRCEEAETKINWKTHDHYWYLHRKYNVMAVYEEFLLNRK